MHDSALGCIYGCTALRAFCKRLDLFWWDQPVAHLPTVRVRSGPYSHKISQQKKKHAFHIESCVGYSVPQPGCPMRGHVFYVLY